MKRPTRTAPAAPHIFRCRECGDTPTVTAEMQPLPCGHFTAFRTPEGTVMFWIDTAAMTLNLAHAAGEVVTTRAETLYRLPVPVGD